MELGIGAGWKRDEWLACGYGFPPPAERLAILRDHLEVLRAMMGPGHATYEGKQASVHNAINIPKPVQQPWVPIMVGGNGPNVTWRLAAKYADELNLDGMTPAELAEALPVIRSRCEEVDRDPASLRISVHVWHANLGLSGAARVQMLGDYAELGVGRVIGLIYESATSDEAL